MPDERGLDNMNIERDQSIGSKNVVAKTPELTPSQQLQRYIEGMEKGEFGPIGGGSSWLYDRPEELASIGNEDLRLFVETLEKTPDKIKNKSDYLTSQYLELQKMVRAKTVRLEDANDFLAKIADRIENPPPPPTNEKRSSFLGKPRFVERSFKTGKFAGNFKDFQGNETTPLLDINQEPEREIWMFENLKGFNDGSTPDPSKYWKPAIDTWIEDLNEASADSLKLRENIETTTEQELKAMMAISASARAMEVSTGAASTYAARIAPSETRPGEPNLDLQDVWDDFLLHNHPEKYALALKNPLVRSYYERLCNDAGLINKEDIGDPILDRDGKPKKDNDGKELIKKDSIFDVDIETAFNSNLIKYLTDAQLGYFNGYIAKVLLGKEDINIGKSTDSIRWSAAKIACDAFLVDKYTRWEYELEKKTANDKVRNDKAKDIKGSKGWGGDPLRAIIQPSFLPDKIKKVYQGEYHFILDKLDAAFRPEDIFKGTSYKDRLLKPTMVMGLKAYARYSDALWIFLGSSRGGNIPVWGDKSEEDFDKMNELLDQVYGEIKGEGNEPKNVGKHVVGLMLARLIELKTEAVAFQTSDPQFRQLFSLALGDFAETNPLDKMQKAFWGEDEDGASGFVFKANGPRTRTVLSSYNVFGAKTKYLDNAWKMMKYNAATKEGIKAAKKANRLGYLVDFIRIFGAQPVTSSRGKRK